MQSNLPPHTSGPQWAQLSEQNQPQTFTKLIDKHYSPMVMRKITKYGFPIYAAIITDDDLSNFDDVLFGFLAENVSEGWVNNIQKLRNLAGALTEQLCHAYPRTEGVGIFFYTDKCAISSLYGDFMNHNSCRAEFYSILNLLPHI